MMKNAFYIILVALSIPKIFKFLVRLCGHVGETAWFKIHNVTTWFKNNISVGGWK